MVKAGGGSYSDRGPELQEVMTIEDQGSEGEAGSPAPGLPNQERVSSVFPHHLSREKGEKARKREAWVLGGWRGPWQSVLQGRWSLCSSTPPHPLRLKPNILSKSM